MTRIDPIGAEALRDKKCEPCEGGVEPLDHQTVNDLMPSLHADWVPSEDGASISRLIGFPGYSRTLAFVNAVGWIANTEGHHPVINFGYGQCLVTWTTNAINGLSVNDFICAAKTDHLLVAVDV
ncbi:MAG: 4a-hydroxytetrahydrobiopterin dehydratase [Woeseiaceae bacterium]